METKRPFVVLAAGGTGGHLFPAIAIAHLLKDHRIDTELVSDLRAQRYMENNKACAIHALSIPSYTGGLFPLVRFIVLLGINSLHMLGWYVRKRPALTIGFGGYPSIAALIASILTRTPILLHEQNAVIGRVGRWLSPWARHILITLPLISSQEKKYGDKIVWVGPILRPTLMKAVGAPYIPPGTSGPIHIFVVGGSQGAQSFSTLIPAALAQLDPKIRSRLRVVQQCRAEGIDATQKVYAHAKINAHLQSFFTTIETEIKKAHLIITRAGASAISEIAAIGRPALFIPLPSAMDDHQRLNAAIVERCKGGWVFDEKKDTPDQLDTLLKNVLSSPKKLEKAAHNIHYLYKADADKNLMILINSILKI